MENFRCNIHPLSVIHISKAEGLVILPPPSSSPPSSSTRPGNAPKVAADVEPKTTTR